MTGRNPDLQPPPFVTLQQFEEMVARLDATLGPTSDPRTKAALERVYLSVKRRIAIPPTE